ncbi:MAG: thiamine pyrophosphate-binding protein [Chloroflexota bacterium]
MRSSDALIQTLAKLGTQYIFALSGNQVMPIFDACQDSDIKLIHVRHESSAVHMADAWGRLTGQPGVALVPAGPGFANALSASYVAQMAESPVVILSGSAPLSTMGRGAFQEMAQVEMATAVSKSAWMVTDPERVGQEIPRAFEIAANGRPGPVHLVLPFDGLEQNVSADLNLGPIKNQSETDLTDWIDEVLCSIAAAKRPLLLAGPAVMRQPNFWLWAEQLSQSGIPLIGMESPRGVNDPALGQFATILQKADLLILLGKKLDFTLKMGEPPFLTERVKLYQIDFDDAVLNLSKGNGERLNLASLQTGNPYRALQEIANNVQSRPEQQADWFDAVQTAIGYQPQSWFKSRSGEGEPLQASEVGQVIQSYLTDEEAVLIADGGEFSQWMQALVKTKHRVINGPSGSIGNAIPFGLAARLAYPNAKIVACMGDGGFGFIPFEMDTAVRYDLPFTLIIGNDARWNAELQIQKRNYGADRIRDVMLNRTNYDQVVEALGGWGQTVTTIEALQQALIDAAQSGLPACINAHIQGEAAPKLS